MLPALAGGLRDGGRFDVTGVSLAEPAAAQAAAAGADAVALFYGAPGAPLAAALQALAPKVRERGGRLVAVLQREQAGQRDECFRAGASDLLFMPTPKDQFVDRLVASVALAFRAGDGAPAPVAVATRSASLCLDRATVSPAGVESSSQLPFKAGETVRLSWGTFQSWGLVVRGAPSAQIRFAGLTHDEEGKIREWVKSAAQQQPAAAQASPPLPAASPPSGQRPPAMAVQATSVVPRPTPTPQSDSAPVRPSPPPPQAAQSSAAARAAPVAGPPPGFMDRKPARPQAPTASSGADASPAASAAVARAAPVPSLTPPHSPAARPAPKSSNGDGALTSLFGAEGTARAPAPAAKTPSPPAGPPWPRPVAIDVCKTAAMQLLQGANPGRDIPTNVAASARKLTALLSLWERASIEKSGIDSHFVHALGARIALEVATAEGTRLASANVSLTVDMEAMASLTKLADEAAARLQKEANTAIGKGEVESLQLITAASAALSRDLLNLKETADKLRGIGAAPRMGAGALDPDVILPGQQPRPRPGKGRVRGAPGGGLHRGRRLFLLFRAPAARDRQGRLGWTGRAARRRHRSRGGGDDHAAMADGVGDEPSEARPVAASSPGEESGADATERHRLRDRRRRYRQSDRNSAGAVLTRLSKTPAPRRHRTSRCRAALQYRGSCRSFRSRR